MQHDFTTLMDRHGRAFHGPCAIRMNLALPLARVQEAFRRLDQYVFNGPFLSERG